MLPETRYARLGDLHLAYQVLGEGPPDLLLLDQWFGNVEAQWDVPPVARLRERLASFGRLIMFDKRGTGLSDPIPTAELPTLEAFMADIPAVLDTVGSDKAALITNIGGGMLAIPFAAATRNGSRASSSSTASPGSSRRPTIRRARRLRSSRWPSTRPRTRSAPA